MPAVLVWMTLRRGDRIHVSCVMHRYRQYLRGRKVHPSTTGTWTCVLTVALASGFWIQRAAGLSPRGPSTTAPVPTSKAATTQPAFTLGDARDLYIEGYYARAIEQFETLAAHPKNKLPATLGIVRCHLMTGDCDEARARLESIAKRGERSAGWHALAAELDTAEGRYDGAIEHARRAIRLDKTHFRARYLLGALLETVGRRDQAVEAYRWFESLLNKRFPQTAEAVTETAKGFHRYNVLTTHANINDRTAHVLNELLQVAYTRMDRTCWSARIAAADLLRSKYNLQEAAEDYKAALQINSNLPEAYVGLGHIALAGWRFEETERRVAMALEVNSRYVPALTLQAEQKIIERRHAEAAEACAQALEINPNDIRALALAAGAALCMGERATAETFQTRAERINPCAALFHSILGDVLGGLRQYAESEASYLRAIACDPTNANTRCELGMLYMQWGEEAKAQTALDAAWALDQFNDRTKNTLDLLDSFMAFAALETEHFIIRYDAEHESVLPRYMADYLEAIYGEVCADYEVYPAVKTIIQVFPTARTFAVRITGKPWVFTVGACTGRVIAMTSPRGGPRTSGPYNYARVLRHEFTHTVTLAATENRIAHWYTEGLAVSQEGSPRSFDWCEMLADRARRDQLFTLESIDWGFIRPKCRDDRQAAYAQSEWMCEYLVERFGYDVLNRMLVGFREGATQEQIFVAQTGIGTAQFDSDFRQWARKQVALWGFPLDPPENVTKLRALGLIQSDDARVLGRLAKAELDDGNHDKALGAARKALGLDENERIALEVFVKVLAHFAADKAGPALREIQDEMLPALERLATVDPAGWTAPKYLSRLLLLRERYDEAEGYLKQLQRNCPLDSFSYSGLAGIYLDRDEPDLALPQLLEVARTEEHDPDVPSKIADIYAKHGKLPQARHWYRQAMYIDPFEPTTHAELAKVLMRLGDTKAAVWEYQVLCELEPTSAQRFADAALALQKVGDTERATEYARKAVELDPASPARTLLD